MIRLMVLVRKRSDMTRVKFKDYWVNKHSELERQVFARAHQEDIGDLHRRDPRRRIILGRFCGTICPAVVT